MRSSRLLFILLILGCVLIFAGIGYGVTSQKVTFLKFAQGSIAHYLSNSTNSSGSTNDNLGYLQMANSTDYFIVHEQDFTPAIHGINTFQDGQTISFTYDPSDTTDIDVQSSQSHLQGTASTIVEITLFGSGSQTEYTNSLYRSNPQSYVKSNWPIGIGIATGGVVLALLSLLRLSTRRRATLVRGKAIPRGPGQPYQSPEQPAQQQQQQPFPSQPGFYPQPPQQQQQQPFPSQPGFYPQQPQQPFPSQPGFYPQPPQQPFPSQPGFYPPQPQQQPQQQPFPSQSGFYPPQPQQQQPVTRYPAPPQQGQYDQTQQAPDPYNR